jgi:SAM-dependent methyltransferase
VTLSQVQAAMATRLVRAAGLADRVRIHVADFHRLPFADGCFDVAFYFEVTGYSPDREALYRESARVLRPGGTAYVKDLFRREDPLTDGQRRSMSAFDELWACVGSPTLSETERAMRAAGFVDVGVREFPFADMEHFYESMVSRDAGGIRLNAFGHAFFRVFPDLPAFFGEAKAQRQVDHSCEGVAPAVLAETGSLADDGAAVDDNRVEQPHAVAGRILRPAACSPRPGRPPSG